MINLRSLLIDERAEGTLSGWQGLKGMTSSAYIRTFEENRIDDRSETKLNSGPNFEEPQRKQFEKMGKRRKRKRRKRYAKELELLKEGYA